MIVCKSPLTYTVVVTSEDTNFGKENLFDVKRQFDHWQTLTISGENAVLDLGSAKVVNCVAIVNTNYNSVQIQGNSSDSWVAPPFDITRTIHQDKFTGRWKILLTPIDMSGFNYQFMRVSPGGSVQDGSTNLKTGGIALSVDGETVLNNPSWGMTINIVKPTREIQFESGRREKISIGRRHIELNFNNEVPRLTPDFEQFRKYLIDIDKINPLIFWIGDELVREDTNTTQYVYVFTRQSDLSYLITNPVIANSNNILLIEEL